MPLELGLVMGAELGEIVVKDDGALVGGLLGAMAGGLLGVLQRVGATVGRGDGTMVVDLLVVLLGMEGRRGVAMPRKILIFLSFTCSSVVAWATSIPKSSATFTSSGNFQIVIIKRNIGIS